MRLLRCTALPSPPRCYSTSTPPTADRQPGPSSRLASLDLPPSLPTPSTTHRPPPAAHPHPQSRLAESNPHHCYTNIIPPPLRPLPSADRPRRPLTAHPQLATADRLRADPHPAHGNPRLKHENSTPPHSHHSPSSIRRPPTASATTTPAPSTHPSASSLNRLAD
jgi:hypothetical protein